MRLKRLRLRGKGWKKTHLAGADFVKRDEGESLSEHG